VAKSQISFFATKSDLEQVLQAVEENRTLEYIPTGLFDTAAVKRVESLRTIPTLGMATVGDSNHETTYLVADHGASVEIRSVPQRQGGVKYAIDQVANPKTIVIRPGGVFQGNCVIVGQLGTASEDKDSLEAYQLFRKEFAARFKKIKSFYVGEEACTLLDKGWRLTASVKAAVEYDLRRN